MGLLYNLETGYRDLPLTEVFMVKIEKQVFVYVQNIDGKALMPTKRYGYVHRLIRNGKAKVVKVNPFTIRLLYQTNNYTQPITLGVDSGYENVGFSAVNAKEELLAGEMTLLKGQSSRLKERSSYRRTRRSHLRYRKPKFDNRKKTNPLAPSIENKLQAHIRLVEFVDSVLPISEVIVEIGSFDIQKLKDPHIAGISYQEGEQYSYYNLREYILHRDKHTCQNSNCNNKSTEKILQIHHLGYWKNDSSDRPSNLITLCEKCYRAENHLKGKLLYGWQPKLNSYRPESFMSQVRWKIAERLKCKVTYAYITKAKRIELKIEKSHSNDACVIAGGSNHSRAKVISIEQVRCNNRSLEKFYDASYLDSRTRKKASGQELNSGRRTRNKNLNTENLHKYRQVKLKGGRHSIRKRRYQFQPKDTVIFSNNKYLVVGVQNYGDYIKLSGLKKPIKTSDVKLLYYSKGFRVFNYSNPKGLGQNSSLDLSPKFSFALEG